MLLKLDQFLSHRSPIWVAATSLSFLAVVGVVDLATGYELSSSIFYAIPVAIGAWYAGKRIGLASSAIAAVTRFAVDHFSGTRYSHVAIPLWNALVRLGFFITIALLLDRLRVAHQQQRDLAQQDGLTGLMNARAFRQRCESVFELASRHGRPLALGYIDLDGFKGVNDSLGHAIGDQVLKVVAMSIAERLRVSDFCGRLGGDEFAILLPETDLAGARTFFAGLRQNLAEVAAKHRWPIGFSIGVAVFRAPTAGLDEAIRTADGLMYRVKHSGKNDTVFEEFSGGHRGA